MQGAINVRVELLRTLAIIKGNSTYTLHRVATNCQDESFPAGMGGGAKMGIGL